mmetsp:Transcript_3017/g.5057  ORF Transcript_3017/g.5057 Transcript_3017/m.5057 type:complete len:84 (+) Transcript_3017:92-343(+)
MSSFLNNQARRNFFSLVQACTLFAFIGVVLHAFAIMETVLDIPPEKAPEKACAPKAWIVLPFAFLTGGLMNVNGFGSHAMLVF